MRISKLCCLFASSFLALSTVFSAVSFDVSAAVTTTQLTVSQTLQVFGDSIRIEYFDGKDYEVDYLRYVGTGNFTKNPSSWYFDSLGVLTDSTYQDYNVLFYYAPVSVAANTNVDVHLRFTPNCKMTNLTYFSLVAGISSMESGLYNSADYYPNCHWKWSFGDFAPLPRVKDSSEYGVTSCKYPDYEYPISGSIGTAYLRPVSVLHQDSTEFSVSCGELVWQSCSVNYGLFFAVACPIVSSDFVIVDPDAPGGGGSGGSDGVDLGETNGLLERIISAILSIPQTIANFIIDGLQTLFIPSDGALDAFVNALRNKLHETFGALFEASDLLSDALDQLSTGTAMETIDFPGIDLSGSGVPFTVPASKVSLKPAAFSDFFEAAALAVDIICTIAFINMLRNKLEEILTGHEVNSA